MPNIRVETVYIRLGLHRYQIATNCSSGVISQGTGEVKRQASTLRLSNTHLHYLTHFGSLCTHTQMAQAKSFPEMLFQVLLAQILVIISHSFEI